MGHGGANTLAGAYSTSQFLLSDGDDELTTSAPGVTTQGATAGAVMLTNLDAETRDDISMIAGGVGDVVDTYAFAAMDPGSAAIETKVALGEAFPNQVADALIFADCMD